MSILAAAYALHEFAQRRTDLIGRVFLEKVASPHGDFPLIWPSPTEFQTAAGYDDTRITDDQKLRNARSRKPCSIPLDNCRDIAGTPPIGSSLGHTSVGSRASRVE